MTPTRLAPLALAAVLSLLLPGDTFAASGGGVTAIGTPFVDMVWRKVDGTFRRNGFNTLTNGAEACCDQYFLYDLTYPTNLGFNSIPDAMRMYGDEKGVFWAQAMRSALTWTDYQERSGIQATTRWAQTFRKDSASAYLRFTVSKAFIRVFRGFGYFGSGDYGARGSLEASAYMAPDSDWLDHRWKFSQYAKVQWNEPAGFETPTQDGPMIGSLTDTGDVQDLEFSPYVAHVDLSSILVGESFLVIFDVAATAESAQAESYAFVDAYFRDPISGDGEGVVVETDGLTPLNAPPRGPYPRDRAHAVAIQADGKVVATGFAYAGAGFDLALARYGTDGVLDGTFGSGGKVSTDFAGGTDLGNAVAIQPDGKIVVAGSAFNGRDQDFAVARYDATGALDPAFGAGGKVLLDRAGRDDVAWAVAIQPDGKIVVAGSTWNGLDADFAVARLDAAGTPDPTFGAGGWVSVDFAGGSDVARGLALQAGGEIVVAGWADARSGTGADFALARLDASGALDPAFGAGGKVATDFGNGTDLGQAVALQADGKIVVAGTVSGAAGADLALARYGAAGALDATFGAGGRVTLDVAGGDDLGAAVAVQGDGKILVLGSTGAGAAADFALFRVDAAGGPDPTFGGGGELTLDFEGGEDRGLAMALQADGAIVAAGWATTVAGGEDFAVARVLP